MVIEQLRVGADNFCYVIYCPVHRKAAIVDPGFDITQALEVLTTNHLVLDYVILTHYHSDHTAETTHLKKVIPCARIVASEEDGKKLPITPEVVVSDGNQLKVGNIV